VVSKYIGETERNLARIFDEAEHSGAVLFFDEADALFGKRSEVKDAHDRYANIEVAYLLQKMEQFSGLAVLATNLSRNMDAAFVRRLQHVIEFPFPDVVHRERIWRAMFPPSAPQSEDLDFSFLARQFEFSGGNIRNVVVAAAFLAANRDQSIGMEHLVQAIGREMQKMGKLPSKADFQGHLEVISRQNNGRN
jgi:SpoVK/Ycf46/Vps4 family AAA+-type ATPase